METPTLLVSEEAGIKTVTINRPQRRNALDAQTLALLRDAIAQAAHDSSRVVILTGAGDAFCSGADLRARTPDALRAFDITASLRSYANTIVLLMRRSAKPFIARVHGPAAGMGCNLALACDLRIASEEAGFSQAFIRIGLMPDGGGTFFLPRLVGYAKAFELMATGALVSARDALSLGLVNQVVTASDLDETVHALAANLAAAPGVALAKIKEALNRSAQADLEAMLEFEAVHQQDCFRSEDFAEGVAAFQQKRPPRFGARS